MCPTCGRFLGYQGRHTCPPRWLVCIGGEAISYGGMYGENPTPSDEERDWHTVRAVDEEDAALNAAQDSNESREYYMMNETYPVWVRPFPWNASDTPKRFNASAEPDVRYSVEEVKS